MTTKAILLLLLCALSACSSLDENSNFHKRIGISRANQLASEFLDDRNLKWGEPVSTRIIEDYVVFYYGKSISGKTTSKPADDRMLFVDIHSGEVTQRTHL